MCFRLSWEADRQDFSSCPMGAIWLRRTPSIFLILVLTIVFPFPGCSPLCIPHRSDHTDVSYSLWSSFCPSPVRGDDQPSVLVSHIVSKPFVSCFIQWVLYGFGSKHPFSLSILCKYIFHRDFRNFCIVFSARLPCILPCCCIITLGCFPNCFECFSVFLCLCIVQRINDPDHARHVLVLPLPSSQAVRG